MCSCNNHLVLISNKEAFRFPYHGTARRCFPAGCLPDVYALRIIAYKAGIYPNEQPHGYSGSSSLLLSLLNDSVSCCICPKLSMI